MSKFDLVTEKFSSVPYMNHVQAQVLKGLIHDEMAQNVLEIGFYHGKSSCYIAAILDDLGVGNLVTIDRSSAKDRSPNIHQMLEECDLTHRVQPLFCYRSYTWDLQKLITANPAPQFDLCYFDGGHMWDGTGFGLLLVDMLLRPGGLIVLDDMDWSIDKSPYFQQNPTLAKQYSPDEREALTVRLAWEIVLPRLGYTHVGEFKKLQWGVARKK
jgi:predicted O-methyltransferase YrrM